MLIKIEEIDMRVLDGFRALQERFTRQAIEEWDECGEGLFAEWVGSRVLGLWEEYTERN